MAKQHILFIINPISGSGSKISWESLIRETLDHSKFSFQIQYTKSKGHAVQLSKDAANAAIDIVCAVGGDGTINEVAQGMMGSTTPMAIIPRGSGNGLARHFSIPTKPRSALENLNCAKQTTMDVGVFDHSIFLCASGIGFDAAVAKAFDQFGKRGFISYAWLSLKAYLAYKPNTYEIELDQKRLSKSAFLIAFANASQFGNDALIAPEATTDDGLLNLVIIKPFSVWEAPSIIFKTFRGTIHKSKYCETITFKNLTITTNDHIAHVDGEPVEINKKIHLSIRPKSLKIVY